VGKRLGAIMPPIGERAISFAGIIPRRFQAIGDTTEHSGFGYHGLSHARFSFFVPCDYANHVGGLTWRNLLREGSVG
jgi:hypothetical protein